MSVEIDTQKASDWISNWKNDFQSVNDDPTSFKTLIYLTLLERQNEMSSYQDIADELSRRGLVDQKIESFVPLRNGMNQLVKSLKTDQLYEIEMRKNKKESRYRLKKRVSTPIAKATSSTREGRVVAILNDPELVPSARSVAAKLMTDLRMPFYSIYLPLRAASRWVLYSEAESKDRSRYERDECERLLGDWLSRYHEGEISLIGLGVGEGMGEVEILRELLDEDKTDNDKKHAFRRVHYCAIDSNVHLLTSHLQRLEDTFDEQIKTGKLVCGVICGNFLENFSQLIQKLRENFQESSATDFLPHTGTVVSILGNVVGNLEKKAAEWSYFQPILEELKGYELAFLLGVSLKQESKKTEEYSRDLEDLLLATPRYLTHETHILKSHRGEDTAPEEFVLPDDPEEQKKRWTTHPYDYEGDGIKGAGTCVAGKIYEFSYKTQWDLSMEFDRKTLTIPAGTNLLLYNIIKFDQKSLVRFLESKGLFQPGQEFRSDAITSGQEDRRYVVIAVTNKAPEPTA